MSSSTVTGDAAPEALRARGPRTPWSRPSASSTGAAGSPAPVARRSRHRRAASRRSASSCAHLRRSAARRSGTRRSPGPPGPRRCAAAALGCRHSRDAVAERAARLERSSPRGSCGRSGGKPVIAGSGPLGEPFGVGHALEQRLAVGVGRALGRCARRPRSRPSAPRTSPRPSRRSPTRCRGCG